MNRMAVRLLALDFIGAWPAALPIGLVPNGCTHGRRKAPACLRDACPGTCLLPVADVPVWRAVVRDRRVGRDGRRG